MATSDTPLYKKQCRTTDEDLSMLDLKKTTTRMHRVYLGVVRDFVYDQCMVKEESPMDSDQSHLEIKPPRQEKKTYHALKTTFVASFIMQQFLHKNDYIIKFLLCKWTLTRKIYNTPPDYQH